MDIRAIIAALTPSDEYLKRYKSWEGMGNAIKSNLNQLVPSNEAYQKASQGDYDELTQASIAAALNAPMAGTFIGTKAKTWDAKRAALAEKLLDEGVDPAQVWKEHLIGRLPGKQLFSEIPDHIASITPNKGAVENGATVYRGKLSELLHHKPLYDNYDLNDVKATFRTGIPTEGAYTPATPLKGPWLEAGAKNIDELKPVVIHEVGHVAQSLDDLPRGGSPINNSPAAVEFYNRLTGEALSRSAAKRADMSMLERRASYPLANDMLDDVPLKGPKGLVDYYGPGTQKSKNLDDYAGDHRAPINSDSTAPLHDLTKIYPEDIYSNKAGQYYGEGRPFDNESLRIMQQVKNNPDAMVTVYRAVPKDIAEKELNAGDWVTLSKSYAKEHGKYFNGHKIISQKVPAKTLFTDANSIHELGYDPSVLIDSSVQRSISELPDTEYSLAHKIAQEHAALPVEQGGLGLHPDNTAMERARALGFDTDVYHASRKGDDISEFGNRIEKTSMFNGLGVHSGTKDAAIQRADKSREVSMETGKLKDDQSVYYPLSIRSGKNPGAKDEYDSEFLLDRIGKEIKTNRDTQEGRKAIQQEFFNRYDSMPYINDVEDKGSISFISPPKNIRSRFAAFDPFKKDSANILASILAGTTLVSQMDKNNGNK